MSGILLDSGRLLYKLPCYGIEIECNPEQSSGQIRSNLHGTRPEISLAEPRELYESAIDGVESLILACACAGIDVSTPAFLEAIETTVDAIINNLDE